MSRIELKGAVSTELATLLGGLREEFTQLNSMLSDLASGLDYVADKHREDCLSSPLGLFAHVAMAQLSRCEVMGNQINAMSKQLEKAGAA